MLPRLLLGLGHLGCEGKSKSTGDEKADEEKEAGDEEDDEEKSSKKKKKGDRKVYEKCADSDLKAPEIKEAVTILRAISRRAAAAFERESTAEEGDEPVHRLCKSANPVPADGPPKGEKYQPEGSEGKDYETGDAATGWRCLKFSTVEPQHFQYGYTAGSGYKGTEHGLPDPGPDGYEAWAIGDLDGDGQPSLFVLSGQVEKPSLRLKQTNEIACVDPEE